MPVEEMASPAEGLPGKASEALNVLQEDRETIAGIVSTPETDMAARTHKLIFFDK